MEGLISCYVALLLGCGVTVTQAADNIETLANQVNLLQEEMVNIKAELSLMETRIAYKLIHSETNDRRKTTGYLSDHYSEMDDFKAGMKHIERSHEQMKRLFNLMSTRLDMLEKERERQRRTLERLDKDMSDVRKQSETHVTRLKREVNNVRHQTTISEQQETLLQSSRPRSNISNKSTSPVTQQCECQQLLDTLSDNLLQNMSVTATETVSQFERKLDTFEENLQLLRRNMTETTNNISKSVLKFEQKIENIEIDNQLFMRNLSDKLFDFQRSLVTIEEDSVGFRNNLSQNTVYNLQFGRKLNILENDILSLRANVNDSTTDNLTNWVMQLEVKLDTIQDDGHLFRKNPGEITSFNLSEGLVQLERRLESVENDNHIFKQNLSETLTNNLSESSLQFEKRMNHFKRDVEEHRNRIATENRNFLKKLKRKLKKETIKIKKSITNVTNELLQKIETKDNHITQLVEKVTEMDHIFDTTKKDMKIQLREIKLNCTCTSHQVSTTAASMSTTPALGQEMNRILVIERLNNSFQNPQVLNLHSNDIKVYPFLNLSNVVSAAYDSKLRRIIFSRYSPDGIFSAKVNGYRIKTVRRNVKSYGMAVDSDGDLIFLTTYHPRNSISRMTTRGKHFRGILDLDVPGSYRPFGIAVDGRKRLVYFCEVDRLSMVDYDGNRVRSLVTETHGIYAVGIDTVTSSLYFSVYEKVMRRSLSTGVTTEVMDLNSDLWKIIVYRNSLYTSSFNGSDIDVIYLGNNVHYYLQKLTGGNYDIVLIP